MKDADADRIPPAPDADWALFLDVDGTLTHHVDTPDAVVLGEQVRPALQRLDAMLEGAVALVTGRSLEALDALLDPLRMRHVAGLHGLEYRPAGTPGSGAAPIPHRFVQAARELAARHDGAHVEAHGACLYLHWRAAPAASGPMTRLAEDIAAGLATHRLHRGAHGIEIRPRGMDKGLAIRRFMAMPPFAGRTPVFAGDDPADEPGFAVVNEMGGISVCVGARRPSLARFALADAGAVLDWLALHQAHAVN
ncbi:trehalose-phosphatase [Pseudoxanthomonas putridarboris]|uniref:Trehalose 6-phosphate phosphatase n=1 Tax=Pseudoxanthomonas putridarboris TaxID=752605 RepID=A0ABU9IXU4_9GAMM